MALSMAVRIDKVVESDVNSKVDNAKGSAAFLGRSRWPKAVTYIDAQVVF